MKTWYTNTMKVGNMEYNMRSVASSPLLLTPPTADVHFTLKGSDVVYSGEYIGHDFVHYPSNLNQHPEYFSYKDVDKFSTQSELGDDFYEDRLAHLAFMLRLLGADLQQEIACIYHAGCPDGLMSAAIVKHRFPYHKIDFIEGRHGKEIDISALKDKVVFIVDFSFETETLYKISDTCKTFIMFDHHQSAMGRLQEDYREIAFQNMISKDTIVLADQKSGCGLTWEILFGQYNMPAPVRYIQDADIWTWKEPSARQIVPAIYFQTERTVDGFYKLLTEIFYANQYMTIGTILEKQTANHVKEIVKATLQTALIGGHRVGIVNCNSVYASEAGHYVLEKCTERFDYAIVFRFTRDGVKLSLRSDDNRPDVSHISSEYFNGGGHRNASGGVLTVEEFNEKILSKVI